MAGNDAYAALTSGQGEITCVMATAPFAQLQLAKPGIHTVFTSYDVVGAGSSALHVLRAALPRVPLALVGWVAGSMTIWSSLFTVGNFLYGRTLYALGLGVVFLISGLVLLRVINQLWTAKGE